MLCVSELSLRYGAARILNDVSLQVHRGERVALLGGNAAGKSSLLRAICGLATPDSGEIEFQENSITTLPAHLRARRGLIFCAAERALFPEMSVTENLRLGAYRFGHQAHPKLDEVLDQVYSLFPMLKARAKQRAGSLSGGEQKIVTLGRALMSDPQMLLLDEPSLGLSAKGIESLVNALFALNRNGLTILFSEQNVALAATLAQRTYVLERGQIASLEGNTNGKTDRLSRHSTVST